MKEKFGRWQILFFHYIRVDYKKILVWILGLGLFSSAMIPVFEELAKGQGLIGMYETLQNPAMISIVGPTPVKSAAEYSLGAMYSHEMLLFCALFAFIISLLHVISHSRRAEDKGLTELIRSFHIGRQANSLAILLETIVINLLLSILIGLVLISFGAETISLEGSFLFAFSIGLGGLMGGGLGLLMAQIMPSSSAATGSSLAIMGLLYIIRGGTDVWKKKLSMINPLAWTYLSYPFTENNWGPIILGFLFCLILILAAFILEGKRDMGAGYLPEREGRSQAKKSLLSIGGLFLYLNKGLIISWLSAFFILSAAYGAIYGDMGSFLEGNDFMKQMFIVAGFSIEESFTSTIMMVMVGLVIVLPLAIINKLFYQEKNGYLAQIYGTRIKRSQLYWTNIGLAFLAGFLGIFLSITGLAATALPLMKNPSMTFSDFFIIGYNLFPSLLFFLGLSALLIGWIPRLGKYVYFYLAYSFFLNYFYPLLDLPDWLKKTAPQNWLPALPMEDFSIKIFLLVSGLSLLLVIMGYMGYKRRDFLEGD